MKNQNEQYYIENGLYTVEEFVEITRDAYGGEIIAKLAERIKDA